MTKIEESGVLSTAEDLGLLSLAEGVLQSDPGNLTALSLPLIVATICKEHNAVLVNGFDIISEWHIM